MRKHSISEARRAAMAAHPAGKGVPESPEVAQARMDDEACRLASSNAPPRSGSTVWPALGIVASLAVLVFATSGITDLIGGAL